MKKIIVMLLAVMLVLCAVGCSAKEASAPDNSEQAEAAQEFKTVQDGKLTIALSPDFSPMEFVDTSKDGQDQYVGFDVTLSKYLAEGLDLELVLMPMSFDACQTAVQMGSVDMSVSGFSWTAEREENFCISDYYIAGDNETEQVIVVSKDNAGKFTKAEDFAGMKVGAQAASLQEKLCSETFGTDGVEETVLYKDINDGILALQTGKIDAMAVAAGNADAIMANNPDIALSGFNFDVDPKYENNVILLNKNSTVLLEKVNELLGAALAQDLYTGWYDDAKELAGIETAADVSYDEAGNVVTD